LTKAIIWDMDGVIADTADTHLRAWQALMAERGETVTRARFAETFGMANAAILRKWLGESVPEEEIVALGARKEAHFRELAGRYVRLLDGVVRGLEWARSQGILQVVASSGEMANVVAIVEAMALSNYFHALLSGAFLPRSKPDPAIFLHSAAAVGAAPDDCLVMEDAVVGVEAARRAGMRCLAVTTTHPADKLAAADLVVDSLADLDETTFRRLLGML